MHRSGRWPADVLHDALQMFINAGRKQGSQFWPFLMPFDDDWSGLDENPIMNFPEYYSLCGGAHDKVISLLCKLSFGTSIISVEAGGRTRYMSYLSTAACAPNKLSMKSFNRFCKRWPQMSQLHTNNDTSEPDWMGFVRVITSSRAFWRKWRKDAPYRERVLKRMRVACNTQNCLFNLVFPVIFQLHAELGGGAGCSRLTALWRDCIAFYDPHNVCVQQWLRAYSIRIRVTDSMAETYPSEVIRHPMPPIGFFRDAFRGIDAAERANLLHTKTEYRFLVATNHKRASYLKASNMKLEPFWGAGPKDGSPLGYVASSSFYDTLKALAIAHTAAKIYLDNYITAPVVQRLLCMKHAFRGGEKGLHVIEDILLHHFRQHREELYG